MDGEQELPVAEELLDVEIDRSVIIHPEGV